MRSVAGLVLLLQECGRLLYVEASAAALSEDQQPCTRSSSATRKTVRWWRQASAMPVGGLQREVEAVMAPDQGSRKIIVTLLLRKGRTRTMPPP